MRKAIVMLAVVLTIGCTPADPVTRTEPRHAVQSWGDPIETVSSLRIWGERQEQPWVSRLLPDPTEGVWGSQDGELFHFRVLEGETHTRATYPRPTPAAIELNYLVRLTETRLAGLAVTLHLVRRNPDGSVSDVAPARSPGGAAFVGLDLFEDRLHLRDRQGYWYRLGPDGKGFEPVAKPLPYRWNDGWSSREAERKQLEQVAKGLAAGWPPVTVPDGTAYVLVQREQLFQFDNTTQAFTLLDRQPTEQTIPLPVAAVDGRLVVWHPDRLEVLDDTGKPTRTIPVETPDYLRPYQGKDGWLYFVPRMAVNLRSGEIRRWDKFQTYGAVLHVTELPDGRLVAGTEMFGSILLFDPRTGEVENWGRPIPELGQESGEEVAPIEGLVLGPDGFFYAIIGTGARCLPEVHLVRMDTGGRMIEKVWLREPVYNLVLGADGRIFGRSFSRIVIIDPN